MSRTNSASSESMMPRTPTEPGEVKRHAACDECRSRKLKCSGEQDGCVRCRRDDISCNYSLQKPMGRPRKRRRTTDEAPMIHEYLPKGLAEHNICGPRLDLKWQDPFTSNFDFTTYESSPVSQPVYEFDSYTASPTTSFDVQYKSPFQNVCDLGVGIDWGDPPELFVDAWTSVAEHTPERALPTLISAGVPASCTCLSSLYTTLSSLQTSFLAPTLPFPHCLNSLRSAFQVARSVFHCPQCYLVVTLAFQNTMLLGTIFPLIAEGYAQVIKSVDEEIAVLDAAGQDRLLRVGEWREVDLPDVITHPYSSFVSISTKDYRAHVRRIVAHDVLGTGWDDDNHSLTGAIRQLEMRQQERHHRIELGLEPPCPIQEQHWTREPLCLRVVPNVREIISNLGLGPEIHPTTTPSPFSFVALGSGVSISTVELDPPSTMRSRSDSKARRKKYGIKPLLERAGKRISKR